MNILKTIQEETQNHGHRTALRQGERQVTYEELHSETARCARVLNNIPVRKYARVGIFVREGIDYVVLNLAVLALDAVAVPAPQSSSREEVAEIICRMKLDALIFERTLHESGEEGFDFESPFERRALRAVVYHQTMAEQAEFESLNPAFIRFTSGTTGESKGVVLSHEAILARTGQADQGLKITSDDTVLWVLSMNYHFVATILLFLRRGAAIIMCGHDLPLGLIEGLRAGDATFIYAAPVHYQAMVHSSEITPSQCAKVRMAICTTTQLSARAAGEFAGKFGLELSAAYGIIEIGLPFINRSAQPALRDSVGQLLPGYDFRLSDEDEQAAGDVNLRGPGMFEAYFSPWQPRDQVLDNGWFKTGDIGRLDDQGFLFLQGRRQQIISFMGMKIFPREVEAVLEENSAVAEVSVYGAPHETFGQVPQARVVLKKNNGNVTEEELRRFCYKRLSPYKVPKKFEFVQALSRTPSGKIRITQ